MRKLLLLIFITTSIYANPQGTTDLAVYKNLDNTKQNLEEHKKAKDKLENSKQKNIIKIDSAVAKEFIDRIKSVNTFTSDFEQNSSNSNLKGSVSVARSNKFLWKINSPEKEKQIYVTNGSKFWHYDIGLEQVVVDKFDKSRLSNSPLYILLDSADDLDKLALKYNIDYYNNIKNIYKLELKSNKNKAEDKNNNYISGLIIYFKTKDSESNLSNVIEKISFTAGQNKQIIIKFSDPVVNIKLNNNIFNLKVPKNVDVIDAKELA